MSPKMTFRQKLIRVSSSAAICGLSYSFMVGEYVDSQAKLLRQWVLDPQLIPEDYLPLLPLQGALDKLESSPWQENLVAANSLPTLPLPDLRLSEFTLTASAEPTDQLKLANAAPERLSLPEAPIYKRPPVDFKSAAEVEKVLSSIHGATSKLSAAAVPPPRPPTPAQSLLQGRILTATALNEQGHFEVGLYSKIDQDGTPLGYPLLQQILPSGQTAFRMEVPGKIERGYLFGEFVAAKTSRRTVFAPATNPWERTNRSLVELVFRPEDSLTSSASAPVAATTEAAKEKWHIQGKVITMFVAGPTPIAQEDVVVKVRGRRESARTDHEGNFSLDVPRIKGMLFLEVLKTGFHPSIIAVNAEDTNPLRIEIASRHAIAQISQRLGSNQSAVKGIFVGKALNSDGTPLKGFTAQLSIKAEGPFYFDDEGVATRDLRSTGANARFLFLNVESGTGFLESSINGEQIAPLPISTVEGGELVQKQLTPVSGTLKGRIFNPVAKGGKILPITGARVRIDGASEWVTSDSYGAFSIGPLKWMKGERVSLEMTAERFNNHRYLVNADRGTTALSLFAFPAIYIGRLAASMDVDLDLYSGLVIGKVGGPSVRIDALADHSPVNNAKDYYFDARGRLKGSHEMTDARFGTFIIFNVPKGRALLQGNDASGTLRYSDAVVTSPASINVQMD